MVISIPREGGHILLDMAMSQYSNGKLEVLQTQGEMLPIAGGFDSDGNLTCDPGAILDSKRALPIGYWKGSALAIVLDTLAAAYAAEGRFDDAIATAQKAAAAARVTPGYESTATAIDERVNMYILFRPYRTP